MEYVRKILAVIASLENATEEYGKDFSAEEDFAHRFKRQAAEIEPTMFASQVVAARTDAAVLNCLRVEYDEKSLALGSTSLLYDKLQDSLFEKSRALTHEILAVIEILDGAKGRRTYLDSAMQAAVLRAVSMHRKPRSDVGEGSSGINWFGNNYYDLLTSAFAVLDAELERFVTLGRSSYPKDPVAPWRDGSGDHRLFISNVAPGDSTASVIPESVNLTQAYNATSTALLKVFEVMRVYQTEQRFPGDERNHALRVLEVLRNNSKDAADRIEKAEKTQNRWRVSDETDRLRFLVVIDELKICLNELIAALVKAWREAVALIAEVKAKAHPIADRKRAVCLAMNNCLAADAYARRIGREIVELTNLHQDHHNGNGGVALEEVYREAALLYRPHKSQ